MTREPRLLPECYGDTLLVQMLVRAKPFHQPNISEVAKNMKNKYKTRLAIGIVDDDKIQPKYFQEFNVLEKKHGLFLKKHKDQKHYIIVLRPALEKWLLATAEAVEVDPSRYGISNLKRFKAITKNEHVYRNNDLKQFINTLKQKKAGGTQTIMKWVEDIFAGKI